MDRFKDMSGMLELMVRPAFAVSGGIIKYANRAALSCMVAPEAEISRLLETGSEEYAALESGCLYLTLLIEGSRFGASVTKMENFDVFVLDREEDQPELQAMALAARELRTPLASMMIAANRLAGGLDEQDTAGQQHAAALNKGMYQLLRLIGNMSDAVRYTTEPTTRQELRDMTAVIREIFEKISALTAETGVKVCFESIPESVSGLVDTEKLERGIYNMVSNAIKFAGSGGTVEAKLTHRGNKLYLTVCDSGSGIPGEILGSIYSRHLRQGGIEDGRYGIGLGMVMIRSAASAHGGTVLMEHTKGTGARVTMTLAIRKHQDGTFFSPRIKVDYAGEMDHGLIELADVLPSKLY